MNVLDAAVQRNSGYLTSKPKEATTTVFLEEGVIQKKEMPKAFCFCPERWWVKHSQKAETSAGNLVESPAPGFSRIWS